MPETNGQVIRGYVRNIHGKNTARKIDVAFPGEVDTTFIYKPEEVFAGRAAAEIYAASCKSGSLPQH